MSKSDSNQTDALTEEEKEFFVGTGEDVTEVDSGGKNAIRDAYGEDHGWQINTTKGVQNFVDLYDSYQAPLREIIANAETACVRRARVELERNDYEVPDTSFEVIEKAQETGVYDPVIEVNYDQSTNVLSVSDNGIGISVREWGLVQEVGLSASHDQGDQSGTFGQGLVSVFKYSNAVKIKSKSCLTGESFSNLMTVTDPKGYLEDEREEVGTELQMVLTKEARRNVDINRTVYKYAEALRVPLRFKEKSSLGDTVTDDEFVPTKIGSGFDRDKNPVVEYEDEFVRAVSSRQASRDTYLISMAIDRNIRGYGGGKYDAPYSYDIRLKREDGPIYESPDDWKIGKVPGEDIDMSEVTDEDYRMPEPAGSRDSLQRNRDDHFWKWVGSNLRSEYNSMIAELFEDIDTPMEFIEMDSNDFSLGLEAIQGEIMSSKLGSTKKAKLDQMQKQLKEEFGLDFNHREMKEFSSLFAEVSLAPRTKAPSSVTKKGGRYSRQVYEILQKTRNTSGDVYMACTVNQEKVALVWDMDDENQVVSVGSTLKYDLYESLYGWKKLKDLDLYDLEGMGLSDELVETHQKVRGGSKSTPSGPNSPDHARGKTLVARWGSSFSSDKMHLDVGDIEDAFEDGESISSGWSNPNARKLVLFDNTDPDADLSDNWDYSSSSKGVVLARAPNYVVEYMTEEADIDNVFTDPEKIGVGELDIPVETTDGEVLYGDMESNDLLYIVRDHLMDESKELLEEYPDRFRQVMADYYDENSNDSIEPEDIGRIGVVDSNFGNMIPDVAFDGFDEPIQISTKYHTSLNEVTGNADRLRTYRDVYLPNWDEDCDEFEMLEDMRHSHAMQMIRNLQTRHDGGLEPESQS